MTNSELVQRKLSLLVEHAARPERRRPSEAAALIADDDLTDAIAMSLLVATQEAADIALHVLSDDKLGVPRTAAHDFELMASSGIISQATAARLAGMTGLRNRIAHGYASVDHARVWAELPDGIDAFRTYAREVEAWVARRSR